MLMHLTRTARTLAVIGWGLFAAWAHASVDVNRATQAELESVRGIGPQLSTKILQARQHGEFKDWGDLAQRVSGIGSGHAARLSKAGLTVSGATFAPGAMATTARTPRPANSASEKGDRPARATRQDKATEGTAASPMTNKNP